MKLRNLVRTQENLSNKLDDLILISSDTKLELFTVSANNSRNIIAIYQTYSANNTHNTDLEICIDNAISSLIGNFDIEGESFNLDFKFVGENLVGIDTDNSNEWYHDEELGVYIFTYEYIKNDNKFYHLQALEDYRNLVGSELLKIELLNDGKSCKLKLYAKEPILGRLLYFTIVDFDIITDC